MNLVPPDYYLGTAGLTCHITVDVYIFPLERNMAVIWHDVAYLEDLSHIPLLTSSVYYCDSYLPMIIVRFSESGNWTGACQFSSGVSSRA